MGTSTQSVETVAIVDLGNDIQFTYSVSGYVYTLNKMSIRLKQTDKFIYITNSDGFINSPDNQVLRLDYTIVSSPVYASNALLYAGLTAMVGAISLGGGGGAGGGNNTWSNTQGDLTATVTVGTKNITIAGLNWTVEDINVISGIIKKIDSSGDVSDLRLSNVTVAGGVITLGDIDDFVAGDTVSVTLVGPDKGYDESLDSQIVSVLNPDSAKWTSVEHLVDLSAQNTGILRYVIPFEGYQKLSMHSKLFCTSVGDTVTLTLFATNNSDADDTSDDDWIDVSTALLGAATLTATGATGDTNTFNQIADWCPLKFMVKITITGTTTTVSADVYIKKSY
jgi:hypothetical protein